MSALRIVCVVALLAALASAAATCGTSSVNAYANYTGCTALQTCQKTLCDCISGGTTTAGQACVVATKTKTCTQVAVCAMTAAQCIDAVAKTAGNTSTCLSSVQNLHTAAMGTGLWNETVAYTECSNAFCHFLNISVSTTTAGTCSDGTSFVQAAKDICKYGPIVVKGSFKFGSGGNFSALVANATSKTAAMKCIGSDLENHLRFPVNVLDIVVDAATGDARVEFEVFAPASQWESKLASADGSTNWMICFTKAKFAELGGTGTFTAPTFTLSTPAPPSPPGSATTPSPDGSTPPPASASMMWSAMQIIVATVAVLVIA